MKSRMLFLSLVMFFSLTPMLAINYNASEKDPKANSIRSCTPACNWSSTSSYHRYYLKYFNVSTGKDSLAEASSSGNGTKFKATAISGNDQDVDTGTNVSARAHAGTLDGQGTSHNSLISY